MAAKGKATKAKGGDAATGFEDLRSLSRQASDFADAALALRRSAGFAAACEARPGLCEKVADVNDAVAVFALYAANVAYLAEITAEVRRREAELVAAG